jgi:hypothetical protein
MSSLSLQQGFYIVGTEASEAITVLNDDGSDSCLDLYQL